MTANKHTPGPWKAVEPAAIDWRDPFVQTADGESTVALTCGGGPGVAITAPAQRANARLIAAAPELLEALIRLEAELVEDKYSEDYEPSPFENLAIARAAIAKATGGVA